LHTFQQRAALAGIKNLQSTSYRKDGPILAVQDRFPEKFGNQGYATNVHRNDMMPLQIADERRKTD